MQFLKHIILMGWVVVSTHSLTAQEDDYYADIEIKYHNHIYKENIKTVQLYQSGDPLSDPIIELGGDKKLILRFDDLSRELRDYYYTFIHCTADWQPSDLVFNEYLSGMPEDLFFENDYSRNTRQSFIHHTITFPNQNMNITKSGNYIVYVFENGDREQPILTRRFMVTEERIAIAARVFAGSGAQQRFYSQQVGITVAAKDYNLTNPYDDVKLYIAQNLRWDNIKGPIPPAFVKGSELEYGIANETVFDGGSEFRFFNMSDLRFTAEGIDYTESDAEGNHVYLLPEKKRTYKVYLENRDLNGKRYIKNDMWGDQPNIDADYAYVHFKLDAEQPFGTNVYILGDLTNWTLNPKGLMKYNKEAKQYQATLYLKQGFYNYLYVTPTDRDGKSVNLEGSHFETENDYFIFVYHRGMSDRYDRLIGVQKVNTKRN